MTMNQNFDESSLSSGRSTVRVKVVLVWAIFLGCWTATRFAGLSPQWQDVLFLIAAIDAISIYFIRCEECHDPLISLRPEKLTSLWRVMAPPKRCPKCGKERL